MVVELVETTTDYQSYNRFDRLSVHLKHDKYPVDQVDSSLAFHLALQRFKTFAQNF